MTDGQREGRSKKEGERGRVHKTPSAVLPIVYKKLYNTVNSVLSGLGRLSRKGYTVTAENVPGLRSVSLLNYVARH